MMKLARWLFVAWIPIAAADDAPVNLSAPLVRATRVVRPAYPEEALAQGLTGSVVVEGIIGENSSFEELNYLADRPESAIFIDAVAKVVRRWELSNQVGADCKPARVSFRAKVEFRIDDGKPRVVITHDKPPPKAGEPTARDNAHFKPIHRVPPYYPRSMSDRGYMGKTYVKLVVDRDGNVTSVDTYTWVNTKDNAAKYFDASARSALQEWKFPPVPEGEKAPWTGCYEIHWKLTGREK